MKLRFHLSGSVLFSTDAECAPQIGSIVRIRTEGYKKALHGGSLIEVPVTHDDPPIFSYAEGRGVVIYINLNGYLLLEEGPKLD